LKLASSQQENSNAPVIRFLFAAEYPRLRVGLRPACTLVFRDIVATPLGSDNDPSVGEREVTAAVLNLVDHPWPLLGVLLVLLVGRRGIGSPASIGNRPTNSFGSHWSGRAIPSVCCSAGFTLAMALPRYEDRKKLIIDEANAIGTTALRARMIPEPARSTSLRLLSDCVDARVEFSTAPRNGQELQNSLTRTKQLQEALWQQSVAAAEQNQLLSPPFSSNL
jgi:hypothetical protein